MEIIFEIKTKDKDGKLVEVQGRPKRTCQQVFDAKGNILTELNKKLKAGTHVREKDYIDGDNSNVEVFSDDQASRAIEDLGFDKDKISTFRKGKKQLELDDVMKFAAAQALHNDDDDFDITIFEKYQQPPVDPNETESKTDEVTKTEVAETANPTPEKEQEVEKVDESKPVAEVVEETKVEVTETVNPIAGANEPQKVKISEAAKKHAEENNIDYTNITGTGADGGITKADINNFIKNN